jgi:hypothetical protein
MPLDPSTQQHLDDVRTHATALAEALRDASDAGVPHGLILPQLVQVFRTAFGEMPPNLMQQLGGLVQ